MTEQTLIDYTKQGEIHYFLFKTDNRNVIDAYIAEIYALFDVWHEDGQPARAYAVVIDVAEAGVFPLRYAGYQTKKITERYGKIPDMFIAYLADDRQDRFLIESMNVQPSFSGSNTRQLFYSREKEQALAWLQSKLDAYPG